MYYSQIKKVNYDRIIWWTENLFPFALVLMPTAMIAAKLYFEKWINITFVLKFLQDGNLIRYQVWRGDFGKEYL